MVVTSHPARNRSGFAGLRLVSDTRPEHEPEPVFTVQVTVADGKVSIEWDPKTPDVAVRLWDLAETVMVTAHALDTLGDVEERIQSNYENRVRAREMAERRRFEHEQKFPWVCACGKRCKSSSGLDGHIRAGNPRCGRG